MNSYRIERPVKWKGEIRKSGTVEATAEDVAPLVKSGALTLMTAGDDDGRKQTDGTDNQGAGQSVPAAASATDDQAEPEGATEEKASANGVLVGVVKDGETVALNELSLTKLKAMAKDAGVKGYSKMDKDELVAAIKAEPVKADA